MCLLPCNPRPTSIGRERRSPTSHRSCRAEKRFLCSSVSSTLLHFRKRAVSLSENEFSNDPSLVPENSESPTNSHMSLDLNSTEKTLGIQWNFREDSICYKVKLLEFRNQAINYLASRKIIRSIRITGSSYRQGKDNVSAPVESWSFLGWLASSKPPHYVATIQRAITTSK